MNEKMKSIVKSVLYMGILTGLGTATVLKTDESVTDRERRNLRQFPKLTVQSVLSGSFENALEPYLLDQTAFRNGLLDLRSLSGKYVFLNLDDNGLVSYKGHLVSLASQIDTGSIQYADSLISKIDSQYLQNSSCRLFYSIVPEKGYFLKDSRFVQLDWNKLFKEIQQGMPDNIQYIDITKTLELSDYYYSDSHWRQEKIMDTAAALAAGMDTPLPAKLEEKNAALNFHGVYAGQTAWKHFSDEIRYLEHEGMSEWKVTLYDEKGIHQEPVYQFEKLTSMDPYTFFLGGNAGMVTIENPNAAAEKELVIFRDSFGSAIAPLLAQGYAKTTLIDLRNMPSGMISKYITFNNQDVLFLFSTSVFNNAYSMK